MRRRTNTEGSQEGKEASHDDNPFEFRSGFGATRQKLPGRVRESFGSRHRYGMRATSCAVRVCFSVLFVKSCTFSRNIPPQFQVIDLGLVTFEALF